MRAGAALAALLLAGGCDAGPPPYGFAERPEQLYELEGEDLTLIDDEPVHVSTYVAFRLRAEPVDSGSATELVLFLERFYQSVERADGMNEVTISDQGILVRSGEHGELRLGSDDRTPTARSVRALLERPIASAIVDADGVVRGSAWRAYDPLLEGIHALEWFLLAAPVLNGGSAAAWTGSREVPPIGRYRLGIQLPLRYEREPGESESVRIRARGFVRRSELRLADDLSGALELDYVGELELGPRTSLRSATSKLVMRFDASDGSRIHSEHTIRIRCRDCTGVNSPVSESEENQG